MQKDLSKKLLTVKSMRVSLNPNFDPKKHFLGSISFFQPTQERRVEKILRVFSTPIKDKNFVYLGEIGETKIIPLPCKNQKTELSNKNKLTDEFKINHRNQ